MTMHQVLPRGLTLLVLALGLAQPGQATTLVRASLDELTARNESVVLGEVVEAVSYWNSDKTFILTDVRVALAESIKGESEREITLTLMGGRVGDTTTIILGGAELIPGHSYVLFLHHHDLPGAAGALTVSDHCQGVFEVVAEKGKLRAVSQANRHPLVPDRSGYVDAPGGALGFPLEALIDSVRSSAQSSNSPQGGAR